MPSLIFLSTGSVLTVKEFPDEITNLIYDASDAQADANAWLIECSVVGEGPITLNAQHIVAYHMTDG